MTFFARSCGEKLANSAVERVYFIEYLTGELIERCLGCGANGCVFLADSGRVVKISEHTGEAPIARKIAGAKRYKSFLPIFYGGWIVPGDLFGQKHDLGITVREPIADFDPLHARKYGQFATFVLSAKYGHDRDSALKEAAESLSKKDYLGVKALYNFANWSDGLGLDFDMREFKGGLAIDNVGVSVKDGNVVIRDLGEFKPTRGAISRIKKRRNV